MNKILIYIKGSYSVVRKKLKWSVALLKCKDKNAILSVYLIMCWVKKLYVKSDGQGQDETVVCKKLIREHFSGKPKDLPDEIQEEFTELHNDTNFWDPFESGVNMESLWCMFGDFLTVFPTTFLCE